MRDALKDVMIRRQKDEVLKQLPERIDKILERNNIGYAHLNGSVPSKQRKGLMEQFREDPQCMVFLSTDAGGVGLNLQSGSVVINMDIPWNPAVLEQRIGRIHRLGQKKTVRVINFVTAASIEENILGLLKFKKSLSSGTLDSDGEDVVMVGESQLKKFMQSVDTMTKNLDKAGPAVTDEKQERFENEKEMKAADVGAEAEEAQAASVPSTEDALGSLLQGGAQFLMALSKTISQPGQSQGKTAASFIDRDEQTGKSYLKVPLPEPEIIQNLFSTFSELMSKFQKGAD